jgi:hypothetical protein
MKMGFVILGVVLLSATSAAAWTGVDLWNTMSLQLQLPFRTGYVLGMVDMVRLLADLNDSESRSGQRLDLRKVSNSFDRCLRGKTMSDVADIANGGVAARTVNETAVVSAIFRALAACGGP